jgi:hypothetical protein
MSRANYQLPSARHGLLSRIQLQIHCFLDIRLLLQLQIQYRAHARLHSQINLSITTVTSKRSPPYSSTFHLVGCCPHVTGCLTLSAFTILLPHRLQRTALILQITTFISSSAPFLHFQTNWVTSYHHQTLSESSHIYESWSPQLLPVIAIRSFSNSLQLSINRSRFSAASKFYFSVIGQLFNFPLWRLVQFPDIQLLELPQLIDLLFGIEEL